MSRSLSLADAEGFPPGLVSIHNIPSWPDAPPPETPSNSASATPPSSRRSRSRSQTSRNSHSRARLAQRLEAYGARERPQGRIRASNDRAVAEAAEASNPRAASSDSRHTRPFRSRRDGPGSNIRHNPLRPERDPRDTGRYDLMATRSSRRRRPAPPVRATDPPPPNNSRQGDNGSSSSGDDRGAAPVSWFRESVVPQPRSLSVAPEPQYAPSVPPEGGGGGGDGVIVIEDGSPVLYDPFDFLSDAGEGEDDDETPKVPLKSGRVFASGKVRGHFKSKNPTSKLISQLPSKAATTTTVAQTAVSEQNPPETRMSDVGGSGDGDEDDVPGACVVCQVAIADVVFVPCAHMACCEPCWLQWGAIKPTCILCRAAVHTSVVLKDVPWMQVAAKSV